MAQPASRSDFKNYCLRQLGAPVLEINVADEQIDDIIDDALQYFHERHFDGVLRTYLKYQVTQDDIDRGKGPGQSGVTGITTTTASHWRARAESLGRACKACPSFGQYLSPC